MMATKIVGHGENIAFTALGDAVNVAARLQDMSKELECEVVISDEVYQTAGLPRDELQRKEITVRGRTGPIVVRIVLKAENLARLFERTTAGSVAAPLRRTARNVAKIVRSVGPTVVVTPFLDDRSSRPGQFGCDSYEPQSR